MTSNSKTKKDIGSLTTLYHIKKGKTVQIPEILVKRVPTYVSAFFAKTGPVKPAIKLDVYQSDLREARFYAADEFGSGTLTPKTAATYLYYLGQDDTLKDCPIKDWTSYGVKIADAGAKIGPIDICDFSITGENRPPYSGNSTVDKKDDHWLLIGVCSYYRLSLASDQGNYANDMIKRMNALMDAAGYKGAQKPRKIPSFNSNKSFCALIAAFDMFWSKFIEHVMADAQIGTISARYQDCTILGAVHFLSTMLGLLPNELFKWIMNKEVGDDAMILIDSPDEMSQMDSYLPYLHGLRLVEKSPYSASTCTNLHFWLHFLGCTLGSDRSQNARVVEGANVSEIPKSVIIVGYALKETATIGLVFAKDEAEGKLIGKDEKPMDVMMNTEPTNRSPAAWFEWFAANDFKYTKKVKRYITLVQQNISTPRKGSVGEVFENYVF